MAARRFPPPWLVEDIGAAFAVTDSAGQKLAYVYYEEEPGRRSSAKLLTRDEARRIAVSICYRRSSLLSPSILLGHEGGRHRSARCGKSLSQTGHLAWLRRCTGE